MKKLIVILFVLMSISAMVFGQVDRDFWFAVPFLEDGHDGSCQPGNGKVCITSFGDTAHVTISQPGITDPNSAFYYPTTQLTLLPYSSTDISVSNNKGDIHRATPSAVVAHGVHVESDADISVYYAQVNKNSELYAMKGSNALGRDFLVSMQREHSNGYAKACSTIEIVATEPNTTVTITTLIPTKTYAAAGTYTKLLQPGEIYTIEAAGTSAAQHLGGTRIKSDKPVAVNSTDDSMQAGGQDLVGDQLVPATLAGSEYIAMRHRGDVEELVLYSFDEKITYTINGGADSTLAASSAVTINLKTAYPDDSVLYIKSKDDKPFVAFQLTSDKAEAGGTILPQLSCTGSREVAVKKRFLNQQLNLLVKTTDTASFSINGVAVHLPFYVIPAAPQWSYCYMDATQLFDNNGVIRVRNTSAIFHLAILDYGQSGGTCSYGYFSGYNQMAMTPIASKPVYSVGEAIELSVEDEQLYQHIQWIYPDGSVYTGARQTIVAKSEKDAGYYRVTGESRDACPLSKDYYEVLVHVLVPERYDDTICRSATFPRDTIVWLDTTQLGCNVLKDTVDITNFQCTSGIYTVVYQTQTTVTGKQAYHLEFEYASPTTAHPNIQVLLNDSVAGSVSQAIVRAQYKTAKVDFVASQSGVMRVKLQSGGVSNSPQVNIRALTLQPVLPRRDTLYLHVKDCEQPLPPTPDPPQPEKDTCYNMITQRWNDVLGVMNSTYNGGYVLVSYRWYVNEQLMPEETKSYIYVPSAFRQGDCYHAEVVTNDGKKMKTCPFCPEYVEYTNEGLTPVAKKMIENNHLVIIRNGEKFNAQGGRW